MFLALLESQTNASLQERKMSKEEAVPGRHMKLLKYSCLFQSVR